MKSPAAAILTIGNEILSGKTINTNASFIAQELGKIGVQVTSVISVGDDDKAIKRGLKHALTFADIIIATGGLGPTRDDITKKAVADFFHRTIAIDPKQLRIVQNRFSAMGYDKMPENNITQAEIPDGARIFPNPRGTAPGLMIRDKETRCFMLPGVPDEMTLLMTEHVIPYLKHHLRNDITILYRTIRTTGIGESKLAELLDPVLGSLESPVVAYLPSPKGVDIRLTVKGTNQKELKEKIKNIENRIIFLASEYVYGFDDDTLEKIVGELLRRHNLTIAVAESCTGGLIGHRLTEIPGSSDYLDQAIVAYSNRSKIELLGVKSETLETFGAVSEQTAQEMAEGIRKTSTCDIGAATTGIAGPTGGTPQKPVGLVYIAIADKFDTITKQLNLYGERSRIKIQASQALLNLLRKHLNEKY